MPRKYKKHELAKIILNKGWLIHRSGKNSKILTTLFVSRFLSGLLCVVAIMDENFIKIEQDIFLCLWADPADADRFNAPEGITFDQTDGCLYIKDSSLPLAMKVFIKSDISYKCRENLLQSLSRIQFVREFSR